MYILKQIKYFKCSSASSVISENSLVLVHDGICFGAPEQVRHSFWWRFSVARVSSGPDGSWFWSRSEEIFWIIFSSLWFCKVLWTTWKFRNQFSRVEVSILSGSWFSPDYMGHFSGTSQGLSKDQSGFWESKNIILLIQNWIYFSK